MLATGCVKQLPPAPIPPEVVPAAALGAGPAAGQGRLVVDVVDGPTPVQRIDVQAQALSAGQGFRLVEMPQLLCAASPCVADLAPGNVLLGFPVVGDPDAMEVELVHVGTETSVYRRSLSVYENRSGSMRVLGIVGTSLGSLSFITGTALLPIGLADDRDGLTSAGAITLGAGAALITLGILAIVHDSPSFRPGAVNHFQVRQREP